jgi:glutamate/tyrosine decarboxylase-like PLP-dependent enzyme
VWSVHVDAAWGGYLATLFRRPDGGVYAREVLRKQFHYFPSQDVYDAFTSLHQADSVTIDPHKLGYIPYAAGAYVARNRRMIDFLAQDAAYVFDIEDTRQDIEHRMRHLGQYILEGSKPGASVAAVHVTHKVVPLHGEGFGRILRLTVGACEYFNDALEEWRQRMQDRVRVTVPILPDTNLICLALNPVGNTDLAAVNRFTRGVFSALSVDSGLPVQSRDFLASYTSIFRANLGQSTAQEMMGALGVDPATFLAHPAGQAGASDHLYVLRHTLMNPWLLFEEQGRNYIDRYLDVLERILDAELARLSTNPAPWATT